MDHTIEVWTLGERHFATCTCEWYSASIDFVTLISMVKKHRKDHTDKGDSVEIV